MRTVVSLTKDLPTIILVQLQTLFFGRNVLKYCKQRILGDPIGLSDSLLERKEEEETDTIKKRKNKLKEERKQGNNKNKRRKCTVKTNKKRIFYFSQDSDVVSSFRVHIYSTPERDGIPME
jgi:hypothetical protein